MKSYLKIKIKSLAVEAQIIRFEERKVKAQRTWARAHQQPETALEAEFQGLQLHRKYDVRSEARLSQIAYAFVRRIPYARIEPAGSKPFDKKRVAAMVTKYGLTPAKEAEERLAEWIKGD